MPSRPSSPPRVRSAGAACAVFAARLTVRACAIAAYGREYLKRILYQMGMSFAETAALEVMLAIQNSGDIQHKFEDQRVSTGSFMTFVDIMLREIRNFDCGTPHAIDARVRRAALTGRSGG